MKQWPMTSQSADETPWIPPVGPPQKMDPFPPPMESEQMSFMIPPPNFSTFPNASHPANGLMNPTPAWTNRPQIAFTPNYGLVSQYPNPEWINQPQRAPMRPSAPPQTQSFNPSQSVPRMSWNVRIQRPNSSFIRPTAAPYNEKRFRPNIALNSVRHQVYTSPNIVNVPTVSESNYVNAILAADKKVPSSYGGSGVQTNPTNSKSVDGNWNKFNQKNDNNSNPRKRPYEPKMDSGRNASSDKNPNEVNKQTHIGESKEKRNRLDNLNQNQKELNFRNDYGTKHPQKTPELDARHGQTNTGNVLWTKLCEIVDKLLDLSPNILKDLPLTDSRVKERNEILMILSDDPGSFYAHLNKYGEDKVKWAVKMAQHILFPQGRYNNEIALAIAPFQRAIHVAINSPKVTAPQKIISKSPVKVTHSTEQEKVPREWKELCEIVDQLLEIPTRVIEKLPPSDSRVKHRNDLLMMLSDDPEDFLLHDDKYGARNVDRAILSAKNILCPNGVHDERVRKIMMRQREILRNGFPKSSTDRSISRESSQKSSQNFNSAADKHRSRSLPKEWNQLFEIVDKVLDTPKEVRIKMSKRDPRWEQRENILLVLSDDPDKLASQSNELGQVNVDWAIKSSKKILFPNGSKDMAIIKKLSPHRNLLLRNRQTDSINVGRKAEEIKTNSNPVKTHVENQTVQRNEINGKARKVANEQSISKERTPVEKIKMKTDQGIEENKTEKVQRTSRETEKGKVELLASNKSEKETVITVAADKEIDENEVWLKLCNIVDKLLDLPANAADKLESSDKRLIERNDILMILSDDPENFRKFDANYGSANVAWAIKAAKKLIYPNDKPNEKLADALWKKRDVIMCLEEGRKEGSNDAPTEECSEWKCIRKIASKVFLMSCKTVNNEKKLTKEQLHQQIELLLQLSDDPDVVRSKSICEKIGEGRVEAAIVKCKHLLNRMRKLDQKALLNFENLRSKMVLYSESLNQSKNIRNYDVILAEVRKIVDQKLFNKVYGQSFNKWTNEQKLERNELAILLIKNPHLLKSNKKYLEMARKTGEDIVTDIVEDVRKCLLKCEYVKEAPAAVCIPIIAKIKDGKSMTSFNSKKLIQRIHRLIEQFLIEPKPEVFDVLPNKDGTVDIVCANVMTFNWLKKSINELDGLWKNAKLSIIKAPITQKVLDIDDLKEIKMMLKTVPNEPFTVVMKQLKKSNPKLNTNKWQLVPSSFFDPKKMLVMVDLESLVELERSKREINVVSGTIYFDIKYIGKENF